MTPLTVDCARVRQLLPALHDPDALDAAERAFAEGHLAACPACAAARASLASALGALRDLPPDDLARLAALADERPRMDTGIVLVGTGALVVIAVALAIVVGTVGSRPATPPPAVVIAPTYELPRDAWPSIGADVGLEVDPTLEGEPGSTGSPAPPAVPAPDVAAVASEPAPEAEPAPAPVAAPPVAMAMAAPAPGGPAPNPMRAARIDPPRPLPDATRDLLLRLQVSKGVRYRDVVLFVVRDPDARDRPTRGRGAATVITREASPPDPLKCAVRPPTGESDYDALPGELLDAPCGLRVVPAPVSIKGRATLDVLPVAFDGLSVLEGRPRRDPVLKGPVLLPSRSRAALISGATPGPVAILLESLADPSLLELRRLRDELARLEAEARDLERRVRPLLEDVRGVRGLALSVAPMGQNGASGAPQARSLDLFPSARELSDALPRLIRTALLEAALEHPQAVQDLADATGDSRPRTLELDVDLTRADHQALVAALAGAVRDAASPAGAPVFRAATDHVVGAAFFDDARLVHALVVRLN